jgi:GPH family glycoside/pentoside/hexuronide:cation symporter
MQEPAPQPPKHETIIAPEDRVPISQKLGYGLGTFFDMWGHWLYPTIAFQIFGTYLQMPFWQIGVAVILNRVFDAVSDPVFGWLSDNARSRWGRRRPFMLVGTFLGGIGLPFLLAVSEGWGSTTVFGLEFSKYFWFMLLSSAVYLPMVSCFNMPYQSLANELTPDYRERTNVFAVKNAIQKVPELALFMFGAFFSRAVWVGADNGNVWDRIVQLCTTTVAWTSAPDGAKPNMLLGAQVYLALCGFVLIVCGLSSVFLVRERYYGKLVANRTDKISIKETLWQTLRCKPFLIQKVMDMGYNMGLSMVGTLGLALTIYFVCRSNVSIGNWWNSIMGLSGMGLGLCGIPVFAILAHKLGKRHAMGFVLGSAILVFFASWWLYTPKVIWLQVFASGFIAFIGAGYWMISGSIGADVMDYDELEGGRRREGSFAACGSWINKVGMAVGAGISFFILGWVGLENNGRGTLADDAGVYTVTVSNEQGLVTSSPARLDVQPANTDAPLTITSQPISVNVNLGQAVSFSVGTVGGQKPTYKWQRNGKDIAGADSASYHIVETKAEQAGSYTVIVKNDKNEISSQAVTLTFAEPAAAGAPVITAQPVSVGTTVGRHASFTVCTAGANLNYQWNRNGVAIPDATAASLVIGTQQAEHTIFMIRFLFALIPMIGLAFSLFALMFFPLTQEKMAEIRTQLEARRGKV